MNNSEDDNHRGPVIYHTYNKYPDNIIHNMFNSCSGLNRLTSRGPKNCVYRASVKQRQVIIALNSPVRPDTYHVRTQTAAKTIGQRKK